MFARDNYPFCGGILDPDTRRPTREVLVYLANDDDERRSYLVHTSGSVDDAIRTAEAQAEHETGDDTWAMDEWEAA